mgnify:CR=1 FL=1
MNIAAIPTDKTGWKLFIKDFRQEEDKAFVMMKTTYSDMPLWKFKYFSRMTIVLSVEMMELYYTDLVLIG